MLTGTIDFMKLWTMSGQDAERKLVKFLLTGLDRIVQSESPIVKKMKVGPSISTPIVRWMEEIAYPTHLLVNWTGTGANGATAVGGTLFGAPITYENFMKVIRVGTILERESDGNQIQVSAVHASNCTFTAAVYGAASSIGYDSGLVEYTIIQEAWTDYREVDSTRALDRGFRKVGTAIMAETFEIPFTRQNTKFELVADETSHQITELLGKLSRQLSYSLLRSKPAWSGGAFAFGDTVEASTMMGLMTWPIQTQIESANTNVWVDAGGAEISKTMLNNLVEAGWLTENADYNTGDWAIICHPKVHKFVSQLDITFREMAKDDTEIGFQVDMFQSDIGKKFPIYADRYMRPDQLGVVDFSQVSYGYYNNDRMNRKQIPTKGRFDCWLVSFQAYGVVVRKPRQSVMGIYNLATTM